MKCHNCHQGTVRMFAGPGRVARHKSIKNLPVPADLEILTCNSCGEEWVSPDDAKRIDAAMEIVYRTELLRRAVAVLPSAKEASRVERDLGLSQGYLSRIRSGTRVPSVELVTLLALIQGRPRLLRDIEVFWG